MRQLPIIVRHWRSSRTTRTLTSTSATALAGRGQVDEAIAHYRQALQIKPDYAAAQNNLGTVLAGRGKVDEAILHYRKAIEIDPVTPRPQQPRHRACWPRGIDEAVAQFKMALEIKPDNVALAGTLRRRSRRRKEP